MAKRAPLVHTNSIMRDIHSDVKWGRSRQEAGEGLNFRPDSCSEIQFITTIGSMTQSDDEGRLSIPLESLHQAHRHL